MVFLRKKKLTKDLKTKVTSVACVFVYLSERLRERDKNNMSKLHTKHLKMNK